MMYILNILKDIVKIKLKIISLINNKIESKEVEYIISQHYPYINYLFLIKLDVISFIIIELIVNNNYKQFENNLNLILILIQMLKL